MAMKHMWCEVYEPLVNDQWPHNPHLSTIPKANTNRFFTKKWSPPEILECDQLQGNICGVRCTSLWLMIKGHTNPIFVENSMNDLFQ
jgi:hypothetical protein